MKKFFCFLVLWLPVVICAQNEHIMMESSGTLCFTPIKFAAEGNPVMHINQADGIGVYDNEINLQKFIEIPSQEFRYLSSKVRTRVVNGVVRTSLNRVENLTDTYVAYAAANGKDYATLSYSERQNLILNRDAQLYHSNIDMREEENFTLFVNNNYLGGNYFNESGYGYSYPKSGLLLDKDGSVFRFTATYGYEYSGWSEYEASYDTITSEKNVLQCSCNNTLDNSGAVFCLSSTLFNNDEAVEYLRPVYTLVDADAPIYEFVGGDNSEEPIISDGEYFSKELAIKGLEIVNENGAVVGSIDFDEEYSSIGHFSLIAGAVFSIADYVTILQLGDNRFVSFDTVSNEMDTITIYKHFYKINSATSSVEAVNTPVCIKVLQVSEQQIEVEYKGEREVDVELNAVTGQRCVERKMGTGKRVFDVDGGGTYILTLRENGSLVGSQKIFVK